MHGALVSASLIASVSLPRALALCGERSALDHLAALASRFSALQLGVVLRDPLHRREETLALLQHYHHLSFPPLWTPIPNTWPADGCEWLHLTSAQLCFNDAEVRSLAGGRWFGASVHNIEEAERAGALGARYLLLSPIYPTDSKPGQDGIGVGELRRICARLPLPVFALGGVTAARIGACRAAGAYGVATVSNVGAEWLAAVR